MGLFDKFKSIFSNNKTENVNTSLDFSSNLSQVETDKIILGIKNVTDNAGSTSLIYMLKKCLKEIHKNCPRSADI